MTKNVAKMKLKTTDEIVVFFFLTCCVGKGKQKQFHFVSFRFISLSLSPYHAPENNTKKKKKKKKFRRSFEEGKEGKCLARRNQPA